ncbi:hypothetical protein [Lactobacillus psittaci]|uniref:Uncharacterized protein n=1 Tax=Lactobacillus psittaci DSM 15354 TaxID=1122152 RepID=A0A0R1S3G9_9LACO|nr:hypothetical protein [Lactobacillus psittaci]KRL63782.1 hypothetical protein FC23_GL000029 [Lactobacillus psittaci DSM 15354]
MQTTSGLRLSYTINKDGDTVLFGRGKNINEIAQIGKFRINRIVASANQDENRLAVKAMLKYCLGA